MFYQVQEFPTEMHLIDLAWLCHPGAAAEHERFTRTFPTHTEDGIPIRKLYVSNLPPHTTRAELYSVFLPYGQIRSCWLFMSGNRQGQNRGHSGPPFGFVTYVNPADAHKALQAPNHEKRIRNRNIRTSPADSWHQPYEDSHGVIIWNRNRVLPEPQPEAETSAESAEQPQTEEAVVEKEQEYTILDTLNRDCMLHIMSYVPLKDLIRSERVSKRWRNSVMDYLTSIKSFKTSTWDHADAALTTAVLRQLLARLGPSLLKFHIDHHWSALNDRTAHALGKFCPVLEDLKVVGMYTKNWNPLFHGCKNLKSISFVSCNKLTDLSLIPILSPESSIKNLYLANNTHVTGAFLSHVKTLNIESLNFSNCCNLQGTVIMSGLEGDAKLKCLKLDIVPFNLFQFIPQILKKVPNLEELSLSQHISCEYPLPHNLEKELCEAFDEMKKLKVLHLTRNCYISDKVLEHIGSSCLDLTYIDVSGSHPKKNTTGITDDGLRSITNCKLLDTVTISYLSAVRSKGVSHLAKLSSLSKLYARGLDNISNNCLISVMKACPQLQLLDVCGSSGLTSALPSAAAVATAGRRHPLRLYVAATDAADTEVPRCDHLWVDKLNDLSEPHLRADFSDTLYDSGSDSDLSVSDDLDYREYLNSDDDFFLGEDYDDVLEAFEWGLHPDILYI